MAVDSLTTPLGMKPKPTGRAARSPVRRYVLAFFAVVAAIILSFAAIRSTRHSTTPVAVVRIERSADLAEEDRRPSPAAAPKPDQIPSGGRSTANDVETESGVRVVRQNGGQAPGATVIRVPEQGRDGERLAPAPDPRLTERVALGLLPKTGAGGELPRVLYARPFAATSKPKIAIVLTGVGVSGRSTADAISRLPGEVTLAFAPYGRDLEPQVMRARRDGHEIMLQVPMEPHDYPDSDPGPHTLRAGGSPKENIDRLHWLMTRFSGYVGIMNFMGGKLMSTTPALQPLFEEMGRRGLLFLDDGSTRQTRSVEIAGRANLPVQRADKVIDASGAGQSVNALLAEAELMATKNGRTIIAIPALPANIDAIVRWERDLGARNLVLAPLSALYAPSRP